MSGRSILVVDDERFYVGLLQSALKNRQIEIHGFSDPRQALDFSKTTSTDIAVIDLSMPHLPGNELIRHLRGWNPFLQVVVITAFPTLQNIVELLAVGVTDFFIKPFDIYELTRAVEGLFDKIDRWKKCRGEWMQEPR